MIKKTVTYEDYSGETVTEDLYFNLSKAELLTIEASAKGGLSETLKEIVASQDGKAVMSNMREIILTAYGKRSSDGKRFIKNDSIREEFESTGAYSEIFIELCTDADAAIAFVNGVVPASLSQGPQDHLQKTTNLKTILDDQPEKTLVYEDAITGNVTAGDEVFTREELANMTNDDLQALQERLKK